MTHRPASPTASPSSPAPRRASARRPRPAWPRRARRSCSSTCRRPRRGAADGCADGGRALFVAADVAEEETWSAVVPTARRLRARRRPGQQRVRGRGRARARDHARLLGPAARGQPDRRLPRRARPACPTCASAAAPWCSSPRCTRHRRAARPPRVRGGQGRPAALTRQLAVEYGPAVRVNRVLPGPILTAAWDRVSEADRAAASPRHRGPPVRHARGGGRGDRVPRLAGSLLRHRRQPASWTAAGAS